MARNGLILQFLSSCYGIFFSLPAKKTRSQSGWECSSQSITDVSSRIGKLPETKSPAPKNMASLKRKSSFNHQFFGAGAMLVSGRISSLAASCFPKKYGQNMTWWHNNLPPRSILHWNWKELGIFDYLVVSTHLKHISQTGSFPQVGVKIKNIWNHHPVDLLLQRWWL